MSYLSLFFVASVGRVFGQKVEFEAGQWLATAVLVELVLPDELQLGDGHDVLVRPQFHKEKVADGQHAPDASTAARRAARHVDAEAERAVKRVRALLTGHAAHPLERRAACVPKPFQKRQPSVMASVSWSRPADVRFRRTRVRPNSMFGFDAHVCVRTRCSVSTHTCASEPDGCAVFTATFTRQR